MNYPADSCVSVIITAFQASSTLIHAVGSSLEQDGVDVEVVLVLDGAEAVDEAAADQLSDPRVKVLNPGRVGRCRALNIGVEASSGHYIRILDADDEMVPDTLSLQVEFLRAHPETDIVGGQMAQRGDWGEQPFRVAWLLDPSAITARINRGRMPLAHPTIMTRRSFLAELGGYDEALDRVQDFDLVLRGSRGGNYANLPVVLTVYGTATPFPTWRYWKQSERVRRIICSRHKNGAISGDPLLTPPFVGIPTYVIDLPKWLLQKQLDIMRTRHRGKN